MEKNQTAMQEMLEWVRNKFPMDLDTPRMIEDKIELLLEVEKRQIIDARVSGFASSAEGWNGEIPCMKWSEMVRETKCEEYYNETYLK
jgi:hypothetical protein